MTRWVQDHLCKKENGWYTVLVETRKTHERKEILGLWRNGVWADQLYGMDVIAYDPVMVMRDTYKHPTIYMEGAIKLAATILSGICEDYKRVAYAVLHFSQDTSSEYRSEMCARKVSLEKLIRSEYFCNLSMGLADSDVVIETLQKQAERMYA